MGLFDTKLYKKLLGSARKCKIEKMRKRGAEIGRGVVIFSPRRTYIDCSRPWLLSIGEYTKITGGVIILTHDYSMSVLRRRYGEWLGEGRKTSIGKNCFLGMNSIILMGTQIGDNCIVGAGSVCRGKYPDDSIIMGNPAKVVMSLEKYYKKRKLKTIEEAIKCGELYRNTYGINPKPTDLSAFKWLFSPRDKNTLREYGVDDFSCNGDDPIDVEKCFYETEPYWNGFDEYLADIRN